MTDQQLDAVIVAIRNVVWMVAGALFVINLWLLL